MAVFVCVQAKIFVNSSDSSECNYEELYRE